MAAHWPPRRYRTNRVPLSHANSPATAVIASRRGLTSNTSWLVFSRTVGVSPLSLTSRTRRSSSRHTSLVVLLGASLSTFSLLPRPPPLGPGGARYHFLFLSFYVWSLPPTGRAPRYPARARASMSERYPHPVGAPRASPSARTLPWRPKINSSCSLHFLPDVKQPFVRSCQARKTVRGVSRFLSLYEWHIDWRFMRSTPDNKYPRARMV